MRIKKVTIAKSEGIQNGVDDIHMNRLQDVVLLAGKNGSGKSRILRKVFQMLSQKPKASELSDLQNWNEQNHKTINNFKEQLPRFKASLDRVQNEQERIRLTQNIADYEKAIAETKENIQNNQKKLDWNNIETSEITDLYNSIRFVPKELNLMDCNSYSKSQLLSHAENVSSIGVESLPSGTFAKIQVIQNRWFNATHQLS